MEDVNENDRKSDQKFTPEVVQKLEEAFAIDATIEEACFYANITRQTYYNHVKPDGDEEQKKLHERFTALRNRPVLKARQTIVKSLDDAKDAQWYLERKRKNEFSTKTESSNTLKVEGIPIIPLKTLMSGIEKDVPGNDSIAEDSKTA